MKINDILNESADIDAIAKKAFDDAELVVFDHSEESRTSVNGDDVMRHAVNFIKKKSLDANIEKATIKAVINKIEKEYGGK